jgi:UDPglucose 6-dehydrogenase
MGSEENMKVCVYGLGHLGSVTAACLASVGHEVYGMQFGVFGPEPKLNELYKEMLEKGALRVGNDRDRIREAEVLWVTFDTPVDDNDRADVDYVLGKVREVMPYVAESTPVIVSSQLPVGTIRKLEGEFPRHTFVCIPENLRHGTAIENFLHPDRIVVGTRAPLTTDGAVSRLLSSITDLLQIMSIESAEMTKHAINAFLATSICFINEIAAICELVGADPKEVERGLKTEARIGPKAYLKPGGPYTGKTLARDVAYLVRMEIDNHLNTPVIENIALSNYCTQWRKENA